MVNWFIPQHIRESDVVERQRAELFVLFALGFGNFANGFTVVGLLLGSVLMASVNFALSTVMTASPLLLRWTGSLPIACNAMLTSLGVLMLAIAFMLGGIHSPTLPLIAICPIAGVFLLGRWIGFFWVVVVLAAAVGFATADLLGFAFPWVLNPDYTQILRALSLAILAVTALVFILRYDSAKTRALVSLRRANQRMTKMIGHLDATSYALSQSAAEFLGAADDDDDQAQDGGLTQQMMTTAGSGRAMLAGVDDSIRGMIEQYDRISGWIRELNQQSGTIAQMVETIDSISDRLDLMALNTGIEAANAGDAGRRFQLLASDMRRLAERVVRETARIKTTIRSVERHTRAASEASLTGQALTDAGAHQLEQMARAFDDMYALIERTSVASERITHDTIAQLATIHALVETALRSDG